MFQICIPSKSQLFPSVTHTSALLCMELYGPRAPLGSQQKIHHLIQLANSFQTSARITPGICGEKPKEEPGQGL